MAKRTPDLAHQLTDQELATLERRIAAEYKKAADELNEKIINYFNRFQVRDAEQQGLLDEGQITQEEYIQWRIAQIGRGRRFEALRDRIAARMVNADETAAVYINDRTPGIYSLNRNYAAYTIEMQVGAGVGFDLWDEQTVRRLIVERPDLMPNYPEDRAVDRGLDLSYGKRQITAQITSGILQGESIKLLSERLMNKIPTMSRTSAIRAARTAVTSAQNGGRLDSYLRAEEMGIQLKKHWLSTLDGRTRHTHRLLDGQSVGIHEYFRVGGYEIRYPGDPEADPEMVYNCFVGETQIASDSKIVRSYKHSYDGDLIKIETSRGVNFTCTPNHPILTPRGWVPSALLDNGDDLLVALGGDVGAFRRYGNIQHIHSSMKTLYNALHRFGLMSWDSTLRVNFHGDIPATNVEVITKKWMLWGNWNASRCKRVDKILLKHSNKALMCQSPLMEHLGRICKSTLCFVGREGKPFPLLRWCLSHANVHGFRTISRRNAGMSQDTINDLSAESKALGQLLDGFSGEITMDKIISVKIIPSGQTATHVYNLQTENGYYFVNSSIPKSRGKCNGIFAIAKNCRCTMTADVDGAGGSNALRRDRYGLLPDMTFAQWENTKRGEGALAADLYAKKESEREARDRKQFAEYRAILKDGMPKTFATFQKWKYNDPEKWAELKRKRRAASKKGGP